MAKHSSWAEETADDANVLQSSNPFVSQLCGLSLVPSQKRPWVCGTLLLGLTLGPLWKKILPDAATSLPVCQNCTDFLFKSIGSPNPSGIHVDFERCVGRAGATGDKLQAYHAGPFMWPSTIMDGSNGRLPQTWTES